jgi:hypothetical protein
MGCLFAPRSFEVEDGVLCVYREYAGQRSLESRASLTAARVRKFQTDSALGIVIAVQLDDGEYEIRVTAPNEQELDQWIEGLNEEIEVARSGGAHH